MGYQFPNIREKNDFYEYVTFKVILWKFEILSMSTHLQFKPKIPHEHMWLCI